MRHKLASAEDISSSFLLPPSSSSFLPLLTHAARHVCSPRRRDHIVPLRRSCLPCHATRRVLPIFAAARALSRSTSKCPAFADTRRRLFNAAQVTSCSSQRTPFDTLIRPPLCVNIDAIYVCCRTPSIARVEAFTEEARRECETNAPAVERRGRRR